MSARALEGQTYDAIVVGSGMTGGWAAKELTEAGLRTLVLERGGPVEHGMGYKTAALDPYQFVRDAYLQRRRSLIYDGNPPREKDDDFDTKPRSESPDRPRATEWAGYSIMVSGEAPTPARLEALENAHTQSAQPAARTTTPAAPSPSTAAPPPAQPHLVRIWTPQPR